MKYLAVIGDIVDSKQLPKRERFQAQLEVLLRELSNRNASLASRYTITLGDEFQAVYRNADTLFPDLIAIMEAIHPARVRFAVGLGELTTALKPKQALGMDGPAFHRARESIVQLKQTSYLFRLQGDAAKSGEPDRWALLNHALNLASHQIEGWNRNRLRILSGLMRGEAVAEMEKVLRISTVAVYKNINAAALDELDGLCKEIAGVLNRELKTP